MGHHRGVRQRDVGPRIVGLEANLNLGVGDRATKTSVVNRSAGEQPRRRGRGVRITEQTGAAGLVEAPVEHPAAVHRIACEGFGDGPVASDGVQHRHALFTAFEFKVDSKLVDGVVVEQIERDDKVVCSVHARQGFSGRVQHGPVQKGPFGNFGFKINRGIRVIGKQLGASALVAKRWARPIGFWRRCDVDVVHEPIIATRPAAAVLVDAELRRCVNSSGGERHLKGGHRATAGRAAKGSEVDPRPSRVFVLEVQVLVGIRLLAATARALTNPSVEGDVDASGEVHHGRSGVGRTGVRS